jgi:hypothetical protein
VIRKCVVVLLLLLSCSARWVDALEVAAGSVVVTPPLGSFLAGYGADRRSSGQFDNIWSKSLILKAADATLVLITIDNIGLTRPDVLRIEHGIKAKLDNAHVVVSSTHTHAGPDVVGIWGPALWRSGRDENYIDELIAKSIQLAVDTSVRLEPARSRVVSEDLPLSWVENISEPELLDSRLSVLQFVSAAGETIATLTNYACHPTVLGPDNTWVSADYVHGFYQQMNKSLSGEHLFLQGSIGGWVQPLQGDRSHELAVELGSELAQSALTALAQAEDNAPGPLNFASRTVDVPLENWGFRLLMWLGVLEREVHDGAMRTSVATFNVGQARFVTHPGETSPAYSLASRQLLASPHTFILGLSQDAMGYILKPEYFADDAVYPHGDYLTSVSVGPEAGPRIMEAIATLLALQNGK